MARTTEEQRIMLDFVNIMMSGNAKENDINEFRVNYVRFRMKYTRFNETDVKGAYTPNERNEFELITDEKYPLTISNSNVNLDVLNNSDENAKFTGAYEIVKETNLYIENYLQNRDCEDYLLSANGHDLKDCVEYSKDYIAGEYDNEIEEGILLEDNTIRSASKLSSDLTLSQFKDIFPLLKNQEKVGEFENIVRGENEKEIEAMEANYSELTDENQAKLSENIDNIIAQHPEILQKYKALLYEYNEDGTKKNLEELEQKRLETIEQIDEDQKITNATRNQKKSQLDVYYSDLYSKMLNQMIVDKENTEKIAELVNTIDGMNGTIENNTKILEELANENVLTKTQLRKIEQTLKSIKETQDNQGLVQKRTEEYIKEIEDRQRNNEQDREPQEDPGVPYERPYDVEEEPADKDKREKKTKEVDKEPQEKSEPEKEPQEKNVDEDKKERKEKEIDNNPQGKNEPEKEPQEEPDEKDKEQDNPKDEAQTKGVDDDNNSVHQDTNESKNIENDSKDININVNINTHSTIDLNNIVQEENEPITANAQGKKRTSFIIEDDGTIVRENVEEDILQNEDIPHFEPPKEVDNSEEKAEYVDSIKGRIKNNKKAAIKLAQKYRKNKIIEIRNEYRAGEIDKKTFDNELYDLISPSISDMRYLDEALESEELKRVTEKRFETLSKMDLKKSRELLEKNVENREKLVDEKQHKQEKIKNIAKDVGEKLEETEKRMEREKGEKEI